MSSTISDPAVDTDAASARDERFLEVTDLVKTYPGAPSPALNGVSFSMPKGSFLVLLGPSGCGKTTTMRSIVGLETPDSGTIRVGDRVMYDDTTNVPVHRRAMGMVFQSYAIWPHRTVAQNVAFPLKVQKVARGEVTRRVDEALELVGLGHLGKRSASALSGGQMQRVALARSIVMRPDLLLLDEPLSNLDASLRDRLRIELKRLQQELGITSVYVTHDQSEALAMADKVAVMFGGVIHQFGSPRELYEAPATLEVAEFLGKSNMLEGDAVAGAGSTEFVREGGIRLTSATGWQGTGPAIARIRVEDVDLHAAPGGRVNEYPAKVLVAVYEGSQMAYLVETASGAQIEVVTQRRTSDFQAGDEVHISVDPEHVRLYEAPEDGARATAEPTA
ncbi:ABC transporter ATP-binding protein [Nocardioides sp. cx-169]|uniref:ABC transporter ATP-binding protein n=1 Tax=Nocardioides sp. cx-169 TaxID=2899080 RepID=UPI001E6549C6|nr:ABC transporter ATP-binding protein [Nocardioides sp. cx-169]MCD4535075.1 ABC transporter ATP-binding protein [Nocardioides sp. cx-169]